MIQRYDIEPGTSLSVIVEETDIGTWVKYDDHEAIVHRLGWVADQSRSSLKMIAEHLRELVAELEHGSEEEVS